MSCHTEFTKMTLYKLPNIQRMVRWNLLYSANHYSSFFVYTNSYPSAKFKQTISDNRVRNFCEKKFEQSPINTVTLSAAKQVEVNKMMIEYPDVQRNESVVDDYFGTKISDPYRWLEDPDSEETKQFIEAQNKITRPYLDRCPIRKDVNERLTQLWNYEKYSCPYKRGNKYFFYKNTGLQNQNVLYVQDSIESEPREFLDPNKLSEDGTIALSGSRFSEDGKTFAYGLSASGSDWITIHIKDVETGKDYPEVLEKVKFAMISWTKDNKGFFYAMYPDQLGKADGSETDINRDQKLYYHRVGTKPSEDVLVVEFPEEPMWRIGAEVSDCGKYLIVTPVRDCRDNLLFFADLSKHQVINQKLQLTQVVHKFEADYEYITNEGSKCIFRTNKNASNYRLIIIDLNNYVESEWKDLVPEDPKNVLDWASAVNNDQLVLHYIKDVKSAIQLNSAKTGEKLYDFPLDVGTIVDFSGKKEQHEIFYKFSSFLTPGIIFHVDLKQSMEPKIFREVKVANFDASAYEAKQIFYKSKDGTQVPMFIISRKNVTLDSKNPTLIYGYGGFNVNIQPSFSVTRLVFMQLFNGVVAIPNIRGGGEYGENWHNGGRLLNKQNVFDDFQSAAEYLIQNKYTTPKLITIQGGSNGGLLVAACINQRPDLYGAAIVQVGVLDMLRFQKFTIGHAWTSDYGSSDEKEHFNNLIKYSPLHNIFKPNITTQYPATLVLTADHDDRVVPLHSLKFIATIQNVVKGTSQQAPLLARIETKSGHGSGKPTAKIINEHTDILCFIAQSLNLKIVQKN